MPYFLLLLTIPFFISCGVKGKPLPPLEAPEIGDGRPQYKGANKKLEEDEDEENSSGKTDQ